jgi:hypothetical protein
MSIELSTPFSILRIPCEIVLRGKGWGPFDPNYAPHIAGGGTLLEHSDGFRSVEEAYAACSEWAKGYWALRLQSGVLSVADLLCSDSYLQWRAMVPFAKPKYSQAVTTVCRYLENQKGSVDAQTPSDFLDAVCQLPESYLSSEPFDLFCEPRQEVNLEA